MSDVHPGSLRFRGTFAAATRIPEFPSSQRSSFNPALQSENKNKNTKSSIKSNQNLNQSLIARARPDPEPQPTMHSLQDTSPDDDFTVCGEPGVTHKTILLGPMFLQP
jgi:hypothetical protein